ncbi:trypsin-like peptidase domain-containing protein [Blastopirellula marina]|uniref:Thioredoxin domain-containing protein n=1 Tax=Blastopirellula marina TaxID=124 RepID=A0A2S8FII6_9BACT|nr:trypsin-like peptidase domain-containing protein [Blastopirellula marina]PQO31744.1 hypothetical protein C5Y98_20240 [Blastopirellula marina]PTL43051.1 hypothetical protein C5Y97_20250 [Blastopirellula marina]
MKAITSLLLLLVLTAPLAAADSVLYCFTADWCVYCHQMQPVIARLQQDGYRVQVVDKDQHPQMAQQMGVRGLPYFVMVSGNQIVGQVEGATSYDRLAKLFQVAKPPVSAPQPPPTPAGAMQPGPQLNSARGVARGQSPQPSRMVQPAVYGQPIAQQSSGGANVQTQAMQASVKLKVTDPDGHSYGSGTVVHAQGNEALVLTCAHLFRDSQGEGPLEVITYQDSEQGTVVPGKVIVFDLDRDVALVAIGTRSPIQPMPIGSANHGVEVGQPAFSVGCDNGGPRNLYPTRINSLNRYVGHDNVQAAGAPTVGRSGGGLFSADGQLIGVCNAADDKDNEGIYAALPTIHAVIQQAGLAHLFQNESPTRLASHTQPPAAARATPPRSIPVAPPSNWDTPSRSPAVASAPSAPPARAAVESVEGLNEVEREMLRYLRGQKDGAEVTVVLRSKDNPTAQPAVFTLPSSPSPAFIQQASQNSGRPGPIMRAQSR